MGVRPWPPPAPWVGSRAAEAAGRGPGWAAGAPTPLLRGEEGAGRRGSDRGFPGGRGLEWGPRREGLEARQGARKPRSPFDRF